VRWKFVMDNTSKWNWSDLLSNKSGNVYVGAGGGMANYIVALNDGGSPS
jgi:hypothetical protein